MRPKSHLELTLIIEGSSQDYLELKLSELKLISETLGEGVLGFDGSDRPAVLKVMKKIDKLLSRWETELDLSEGES